MAIRRRRHAGAELRAVGTLGSIPDIGRRRTAVIDIVLRNATILDGTGGPAILGDLAIDRGRIVSVGSPSPMTPPTKRSTCTG